MNARRAVAVTRVEWLTPAAPAGIAVLRLIGPDVIAVLCRACRRVKSDRPPEFSPGTLTYCRFFDGDEPLDDIVVALTSASDLPVADLCFHGGVRLIQRALLALQALGVEWMPPLELAAAMAQQSEPVVDFADAASIRALIDAELVAALPLATTRTMAAWLLRQADLLAGMLASDQTDFAAFERRSRVALGAFNGLSVALVGPPNAGKSTLANALMGRDHAIVSDTPGTTRDWVEGEAFLGGWPVTLTDTAGLRTTGDALEQLAMQRGRVQAARADLVLCVMDHRAYDAAEMSRMLAAVRSALPKSPPVGQAAPRTDPPMPPTLLVLNKSDLPGASESAPAEAVRVSALHGAGLDALVCAMMTALQLDLLAPDQPTAFSPRLLTLARERSAR